MLIPKVRVRFQSESCDSEICESYYHSCNAGGASTKFLKVKVERESCEVEIIIIGPAVSFPLLVGRVQRS